MTEPATSYHLVRPSLTVAPPVLDEQQQRVVDHAGGPLLVLAGPGTGKTTTLVEAIVRRIEEGTHPDRILALTFSRKAAEQLRDRVTARVGRTMSASMGSTFHSFAYGLIRRYAPAELYEGPLRLLSAPEQDVVLQELLSDAPESIRWPDALRRAARHPRLRARGARGAGPGPREGAGRRRRWSGWARSTACPSTSPPAASSSSTSPSSTPRRGRLRRPDPAGRPRGRRSTATSCARATPTSSSTSTRTPTPARWPCSRRSPATAATWSSWATRTSRSTRSAAPTCAASSSSRPSSRGRRHARPRWSRSARPAGSARACSTRRPRIAARLGAAAEHPRDASREAFLATPARARPARRRSGRRPHLRHRPRRDRAPGRPAPPRAPRGRRAVVRDGGAGPVRPPDHPARCAARSAPPASRSRWPPTTRRSSASPPCCRCSRPAARCSTSTTTDPDRPGYVDPARAEGLLDRRRWPASTRPTSAAWPGRCAWREKARAQAEDRLPSALAGAAPRRRCVDPAGPRRRWTPGRAGGGHGRGARRSAAPHAGLSSTGATAEEVLWTLWSGTRGRAGSARRRVEPGGAAARSAHRDLDAVWPSSRRRPAPRSTAATPASSRSWPPWPPSRSRRTPSPSGAFAATPYACSPRTGPRGSSGGWSSSPTSRRTAGPTCGAAPRCSGADRIGARRAGPADDDPRLLAEERRLFYVACTRARERLVVTAVRSTDDDGEQPSRFLAELVPDVDLWRHHAAGPTAAVAGRTGRRAAPHVRRPDQARAAAPGRRPPPGSAGAEAHAHGEALVPAADPASWWGTPGGLAAPYQPRARPGRAGPDLGEHADLAGDLPGAVVPDPRGRGRASRHTRRRASATSCTPSPTGSAARSWPAAPAPTRGGRADGARRPGLGPDAVPDPVVTGAERERRPQARWSGSSPGTTARPAQAAGHRAADCRHGRRRCPTATEVRLDGYADRLELDAEGRVVVVDLKTGKYAPTKDEVAEHPQLGLYQLAVDARRRSTSSSAGCRPRWSRAVAAAAARPTSELKVQRQEPQQPGDDGPGTIEQRAADRPAARLRDEEFPARPATTAATATSCPSARPRAPARW